MNIGSILNLKNFKKSLVYAFFLMLAAFPALSFASDAAGEKAPQAEKKFSPKDIIFEHIGDAHSWPVAVPLMKEVFLPLPMILFTD